ncbi:DsrE family protein [Pseudorhodoferax sp. Leaf274]|uniref:DsrE family protein n=1 Tax=Pseudorhodoferax sp. Leaf274 TaxID=1736318 RepID=UPI0007036F76|nr:DsrE family protein [Pseudorhodoferax sp. Leaf274]KQP41132.1 hypothetical protein ASF44_30270 [Pseudorhodoferax sp. Leaf274]
MSVRSLCLACMVAFVPVAPALATEAGTQRGASISEDRVVYHVDDIGSAREALANMVNHLNASPNARITLLANGKGVYMLVAGEKDQAGEYGSEIAELQLRGVRFVACRNSMERRKIETSRLVSRAETVQAGVVELSRLQRVEGAAYIKP